MAHNRRKKDEYKISDIIKGGTKAGVHHVKVGGSTKVTHVDLQKNIKKGVKNTQNHHVTKNDVKNSAPKYNKSVTGNTFRTNRGINRIGNATSGAVKDWTSSQMLTGSHLHSNVNAGRIRRENYSRYRDQRGSNDRRFVNTTSRQENRIKTDIVQNKNKVKNEIKSTQNAADIGSARTEKQAFKLQKSAQKDLAKSKKGTGKVGGFLIDAYTNGMEMGLDLLAGGGATAMPSLTSRSYGGAYMQAISNQKKTNGSKVTKQMRSNAAKYALGESALQAGTEKMFAPFKPLTKMSGKGVFGSLGESIEKKTLNTNAVKGLISKGMSEKTAGRIVKGLVGTTEEGFEEVAADIPEPLLQSKTYDKDAKKQYKQGSYYAGMARDFGLGAGTAALLGGANAAIEGGNKLAKKDNGFSNDTKNNILETAKKSSNEEVKTQLNAITSNKEATDKDYRNLANSMTLEEATKQPEDSEAYQRATQIQKQKSKGYRVIDDDYSDLANKVYSSKKQISERQDNAIREATAQLAGDTSKINRAAKVTASDAPIIMNLTASAVNEESENAEAVLRSIMPNADTANSTQLAELPDAIGRIQVGTATVQDYSTIMGSNEGKALFTAVSGQNLPPTNSGAIDTLTQYTAKQRVMSSPQIIMQAKNIVKNNAMNAMTQGLTENESKAYMAGLDNLDTDQIDNYNEAFLKYFNGGFVKGRSGNKENGFNMDTISKNISPEIRKSIGEVNAKTFYEAGIKRGTEQTQKAEKSSTKVKKTAEVKTGSLKYSDRSKRRLGDSAISYIEAVAVITGTKIEIKESTSDSKNINGYFKGNDTIVLYDGADNPLGQVIKHELTHYIKKHAPKEYEAYQSFIIDNYYKYSPDALSKRVNGLISLYNQNGVKLTYEDALEELCADATDVFFKDSDMIDRICRENRTLAEKIYDGIKSLLTALKKLGQGSKTNYGGFLKTVDALDDAERLWTKALAATAGTEVFDNGNEVVQYSIRQEDPPKKTIKAYKVFVVKEGKLYPPMVANPEGADTPVGVWLNADVGKEVTPTKTGRRQVKAGGKGTQGGSGSLSYRPGWHLGAYPMAKQFARLNPKTGKKELFPENFVWAECEIAADKNYQNEAHENGMTKNGKFNHAYAGLQHIPEDGYYEYRTNPDPTTKPWYITGAMKVVKILDDAETNKILSSAGEPIQHRKGGSKTLKDLGLDDVQNKLSNKKKLSLSEQQYNIIKNSNPMADDYHTGIRSATEIKTLSEALNDKEYAGETEFVSDWTRAMAEKALKSGSVIVYSSHPIENGAFVTPSQIEARSYAGSKKLYEKKVQIENVAWIDAVEGQYADTTKYSMSNAYHAGDLGKSESYFQMMSGSRSTGHFGTGTYFVGDKIKVDNYNKRDGEKAPVETVDFSNYNLFKPKNYKTGMALHEDLKKVNNLIGYYDYLKTTDLDKLRYDISDEFYSAYNDGKYDYSNMPKTDAFIDRFLGSYTRNDIELKAERYYNEYKNDPDRAGMTKRDYYYNLMEDMIDNKLDENRSNNLVDRQNDINELADRLSKDLGASKAKIESALKQTANYDAEISDKYAVYDNELRTADSPSTVFMKALGYEGIDVRNIDSLDNTSYGSVIYDLKGKDAQRKKDIGTAKYSISTKDSQGNKLSDAQRTFFKDSKAVDRNGNLALVYHGSDTAGLTRFNPKASWEGYGTFFTSNKTVADTYAKGADKNYACYLNLKNPLIIDTQGDSWEIKAYDENGIEEQAVELETRAEKETDENKREELLDKADDLRTEHTNYLNTNEWTKVAKDKGYDGVIFRNIYDVSPNIEDVNDNIDKYKSDVYVAFNPNQIKNTDNQNPTSNPDIRFSMSDKPIKGLEGLATTELSSNQLNHDIFLSGQRAEAGNDYIYEFLTATKINPNMPKEVNKDGRSWTEYVKEFTDDNDEYGGPVFNDYYYQVVGGGNGAYVTLYAGCDSKKARETFDKYAKEERLDPVRDGDTSDKGQYDIQETAEGQMSFKFSMSAKDSEGNSLTDGQKAYFANTKAVDEKGNLAVVYHGTDKGGFTVFNRTNNYYTDNNNVADSYTENKVIYKGYLNIKNPLVIDVKGNKFSGIPVDNIQLDNIEGLALEYGMSTFNENGKMRTSTADIVSLVEDMNDEGIGEYDGVIFHNIYDEGNYKHDTSDNMSSVYVTFDSNQFKDVSNEHPTKNEDIRYQFSNKAPGNNPALAVERKHNKRMEKEISRLKGEFKRSKNVTPDEKDTNRSISQLVKSWDAKMSSTIHAKVKNDVTAIYRELNQKNPGWSSIQEFSYDAADLIIDESEILKNSEAYELRKSLIKYLRNDVKTIRVSEGHDNTFGEGFNAMRKSFFGIVNLSHDKGNTIDQYWGEMQELYPGIFTDDTWNEGDMLTAIKEVLDNGKPSYGGIEGSEYGLSDSELEEEVAKEVLDMCFGLKQNKTFADKKAEEKKAALARQKKRMDDRYNKMVEKNRKRMADKDREYREKIKDVRSQYKDKKDRKYYTERIKSYANWMSGRLLQPTEGKYIPEGYRKAVAELLSSFDFETNRTIKNAVENGPSKRMIKVAQLVRQYQNIIADDESMMQVSDDFQDKLNKLAVLENKRVVDLTTEELADVYHVVKDIATHLSNMNKAFADGVKEQISELGDAVIAESRDIKDRSNASGIIPSAVDFVTTANNNPIDEFVCIGGTMEKLYMNLRKGFDKYIRNAEKIKEFTSTLQNEYSDIKNWSGDRAKAKTFKMQDGKTIQLTASQVMSLYCLSKRPQALTHLMGSGIVSASVLNIKGKAGGRAFKSLYASRTSESRVMPTTVDINNILKTLTPDQIKVADYLQDYMVRVSAKLGNETSKKLYDIKKFNDPNYFPIKSSDKYLEEKFDNKQPSKIKNVGFTKETVKNASNPIVIDDIFNVFTNHTSTMAQYNALVPPLTDFERVFNYKQRDENGRTIASVRERLDAAYGRKTTDYITKFINDVNKNYNRDSDHELFNKIFANTKKGTLGFSLRVAIQQPTAIFRAGAVINPKYLMDVRNTAISLKEMREHSPIALWKSWGFYNTDVSSKMSDIFMNRRNAGDKLFMGIYGTLDDITWGYIWNATKAEIKQTRPELEKGSKAYWNAVNDRFSYIVDRTQVVDSVFHRSQIMRKTDMFSKLITAYMAEPTKTYNMLKTELTLASKDIKAGNKADATKRISRVTSVFFANAIAVSVAAALIDVLRSTLWDDDDNDDKDFLERWLKYSEQNTLQNINPLSFIPGLRDVQSIFQGYDANRTDLEVIIQLKTAIDTWTNDTASTFKKIKVTAKAISLATGIPVSNIIREGESAYFEAVSAISGSPTKAKYMMHKLEYNYKSDTGESKLVKDYKTALKQGDTTAIKYIKKDLTDNVGVKPERLSNVVKNIYSDRLKAAIATYDADKVLKLIATEKAHGADTSKMLDTIVYKTTEDYKKTYDLENDDPKTRTKIDNFLRGIGYSKSYVKARKERYDRGWARYQVYMVYKHYGYNKAYAEAAYYCRKYPGIYKDARTMMYGQKRLGDSTKAGYLKGKWEAK